VPDHHHNGGSDHHDQGDRAIHDYHITTHDDGAIDVDLDGVGLDDDDKRATLVQLVDIIDEHIYTDFGDDGPSDPLAATIGAAVSHVEALVAQLTGAPGDTLRKR
jgi:hypothetical protein